MDFIVEIENLTKDYEKGFWKKKKIRALDGLTLNVEAGQIFGFLGGNGAGKTTTIKILMSLIFPSGGSAKTDGGGPGQQGRSGIQPLVHLHDGHAGLAVAGLDGALDGRRAAPARQQRGVDIDASEPGNGQHRRGQQQTIGHHHNQVRRQGGQLVHGPGVPKCDGLHNPVPAIQCILFNRTGPRGSPAARRTVRLGVYGADPPVVVIGPAGQCLEGGNGEFGRAREYQAHRKGGQSGGPGCGGVR